MAEEAKAFKYPFPYLYDDVCFFKPYAVVFI